MNNKHDFCFQFVFKDVKFIEPQEQILAIANVGQVGICLCV